MALAPGDVIDFSANVNPFGPAPAVREAIAKADIASYPDDAALRQVIAAGLGIAPANVLPANGSVELLWLVVQAYLSPNDPVLIVGPTFGEYERACLIGGARVHWLRADAAQEFYLDLEETARLLDLYQPRLLFLCNPNNPTGVYLRRAEIERLLAHCQRTLLVVDEAFVGFVEAADSLIDLAVDGRLLLLRSMTKDHALAGLRLGYAVGDQETMAALRTVQPPWNVSAAAQAGGIAALADREHLALSLARIREAKHYLAQEIISQGLKVYPAETNFLLAQVGDAARFRAALLRRGCCVRDCSSFGLPDCIRIGVRSVPDCRRLVAAINEVLREG
ncbi:MAG: histidinol-phosphate aminotransferase family protein [Chloroflexi bacterium]|nr:histidinol-phosphate aminotransferase family protein [Chloroflexota bacterium]